jgi:hypothetical protein
MKGRHTSFQRFGSGSHNPFGSVLNKYLRTSKDRENDIYKKTATTISEPDLGEEVYGCLSKGIGTTGYPESNADYQSYQSTMIDKRESREGVDQYFMEPVLRSWEEAKSGVKAKDYALIAQENIPINTCSKYPINFSAFIDNQKVDIKVKGGAGFSGPYQYRPSKFGNGTNQAITEDAVINERPVSSISIPVATAHQILNCTRKISFTASFSHESKRKTVKCNGNDKATVTENSFFAKGSICQYAWAATKRVTTYACESAQETGTAKISGDIEGSMSRYKEMTSLWEKVPEQLDLSANCYIGSNAKKAMQHAVITSVACNCEHDCPDSQDFAKAKLLGERVEVTKLDASCAVVPRLDADLIRRNQGDNLLASKLGNPNCQNEEGLVSRGLYSLPALSSGIKDFTSGPSLTARYVSTLYDFVGSGNEERVYQDNKCGQGQVEVFRSPTADTIPTGLKLVRTGSDCGLFDGMMSYDYILPLTCFRELSDPPVCSDFIDNVKWGFPCEYSKQCYDDDYCSHPSGSDLNKATRDCSVSYRLDLHIGNYVDTNGPIYQNGALKYYAESPIPLSIYKKQGEVQDVNICFIFSEDFDIQQSKMNVEAGGRLPLISTCKEWHNANKSGNQEVAEAGTLTLQHEDWSQEIKLWTLHDPSQKESCDGVNGGTGWIKVPGAAVPYCDFFISGEEKGCFPEKCVLSVSDTRTPWQPKPPDCCDNCCPGEYAEEYYKCGCGCNCNCVEYLDGGYADPCSSSAGPQPEGSVTSSGFPLGCYGTAQDLEELTTKLDITLKFESFTEPG